MGEAKFTPGPWRAEAEEVLGWRGEPRESEYVCVYSACSDEEDEGLVASVALVSGEFGTPVAGWDNAHLIAAAPDLYEALRRAQEELRLINMKDTGAIYDVGLRADISAALAKACPTPVVAATDNKGGEHNG